MSSTAAAAFSISGITSQKRGSSASSGQPEMLEGVADVAGRADDAQVDGAAVRRQVIGHERVHTRTPSASGISERIGLAGLHALGRRWRRLPTTPCSAASTSSSTASPVRSRWNSAAEMPPRDVHPADRVAERRNALRTARRPAPRASAHGRRRCASRTPCRRSRRCRVPGPLSP